MGRDRTHITDAELDVLKGLWEMGDTTIRQLTDRLYPHRGTAHYATVQKLLERLQAKGCVKRRRGERVNVYTATLDREGLIARRLQETADRLCEGSLTPLLTQLAGVARLAPRDIAALREVVERLDRRRSGE